MRDVSEHFHIQHNLALDILEKGSIHIEGQFIIGSNYTFLATVKYEDSTYKAVYKPQKGEIPLWDFPPETLASRETAAFLLSEAITWGFVPPTIFRSDAPFGPGSLQWFIPHDPEINYFTFSEELKENLRSVAVFDMIINNADRKGSHMIIDEHKKVWLIDHGISFHIKPKLRTVIWDFIGESISEKVTKDVRSLNHKLTPNSLLMSDLEQLLSLREITALKSRVDHIIDYPFFPAPDENYRPFPFPLV
jgi:uncharacterized repeat protein (TIGR03843 family)